MNIELIPAIDIIGGKCVRLTKGDYGMKTVYNEDPVAQAIEFERLGFRRLHIVDLDGAKASHIVNEDILRGIVKATRLKVDFGGGVKSCEDMEKAFSAGAEMVTVGSVAVREPQLFLDWLERYGSDKIILGADVRNGRISINGWKEETSEELLPFLAKYVAAGIKNVLCTDISRDGTLNGPAVGLYESVMMKYPQLHLIASGGVGCDADILDLAKAGVPAVVFGKAWYEGKINLKTVML